MEAGEATLETIVSELVGENKDNSTSSRRQQGGREAWWGISAHFFQAEL